MSNNVLKRNRIKKLPGAMVMQPPKRVVEDYTEVDEEKEVNRLSRLREEADDFRNNWSIERESIISQARVTAERIIEEAGKRGEELITQRIEEAGSLQEEAKQRVERLTREAETKVEETQNKIERDSQDKGEQAYREGLEKGMQKGLEEGTSNAELIVEQLQVMLNKVIERRSQMIDELESQILHLVLQMVRKVVKALSEESRSVVVNNVVYALRKLRKKTDVVLRVNFSQMGFINKHLQGILKLSNQVNHVSVVEDTSVEPGGCIVETDFGNIDARISSQLDEVERRVREMIPVQRTGV